MNPNSPSKAIIQFSNQTHKTITITIISFHINMKNSLKNNLKYKWCKIYQIISKILHKMCLKYIYKNFNPVSLRLFCNSLKILLMINITISYYVFNNSKKQN